ncbi:MAG TPA: hypothetical protein VFW80_04940 [Gaiellaceae bacterium]|nr:hypothetical protein [Gaiellaceae bacterium]
MIRVAALSLVLFSLLAGEARAEQQFHVYVANRPPEDVSGGAEGLLVPGAGPETSFRQAFASLLRGEARNSLRGGLAGGPPLIEASAPPKTLEPPYILVTLPQGGEQPNDRRYPIAVVGAGYDGILVSDSTRIPGLVSIADIAPTALGEDGALRSQPDADPLRTLRELDDRIDGHNRARLPAGILAAVLIVLLTLLWPRAGLLAFGAALAANLVLGVAEASSLWPTLVAIGLAAGLGGPLLALVLRSDLEIGLFLATIVGAYLVVLGVEGPAVALSPFGPSQSGRFYGLSNLLETMLLVPTLAGAVFLRRRLGWGAFAAVAAAAFVAVAGDRFGADAGGAIVLAVGFGLLAALLAGLRGRRLAVTLAAVVVLAAGLAALDAAIGPTSHLTHALDSGPDGLASALRDRVELSWERIAHEPAAAAVFGAGLALLVLFVARVLGSDAPLERRALPLAFAAALAASFVLNDSPNDVAAAGLVGYLAVEAVMLRDRCAALLPSPGPSPRSSSSLPAAAPRRP